MARAWDFVQFHHKNEIQMYREELGRWPNVATGMFEWINSEQGQTMTQLSIWDSINPFSKNDVRLLDQTDDDPLTKDFKIGDFERDVETWVACVDFIDGPMASNVSTAVTRLEGFLRHYYQDDYRGLRSGGKAELKDVVMLWCASVKGRVERRIVANLLDEQALVPY